MLPHLDAESKAFLVRHPRAAGAVLLETMHNENVYRGAKDGCVINNVFQDMMKPLHLLNPSKGSDANGTSKTDPKDKCLNTSLGNVQKMILDNMQAIGKTLEKFVARLKNTAEVLGMSNDAFQEVLVRCSVKMVSGFVRFIPLIPDGIFDMMDNIVVNVIKKRYDKALS